MGFMRRQDELERELRAQRPEPRRELIDGIASRIVGERRHGASRGARLGVAVALSAGMFAALGAFGGLSYAANGVTHAVTAAVHTVVPAKSAAPDISNSSARAQYRVTMCFHGHTLEVDSHAQDALASAGAESGPCAGGTFKPAGKLAVACLDGQNVWVPKAVTKSKTQLAKLKKLGITTGFCS
jgi:hypothetical protein